MTTLLDEEKMNNFIINVTHLIKEVRLLLLVVWLMSLCPLEHGPSPSPPSPPALFSERTDLQKEVIKLKLVSRNFW